jgi:hypothetical protein
MIQSDLLKEKQRVQALLSKESASTREYLINANWAAKEIAKSYGLNLKYAEMPNKTLQRKLLSSRC